jgi:hypothetical protein
LRLGGREGREALIPFRNEPAVDARRMVFRRAGEDAGMPGKEHASISATSFSRL